MRRSLPLLLAAVLAAQAAWAQPWAPDPLQPVSSGGLEAVDRALARLSVHARLLVVGAHPDDEDNTLLAWVARGLGGEAAYLSLSRGEGGQNLIGPELGVELGAIRTGELLAARRLEGSRQYFARAYDFGYTRSLEETFERWPRQVLREDAVRVVRRFKPQVIVAVFPADERAGHGQHQASAVIAADAFELAGEAGAFAALPDGPWRPSALYRRAWLFRGEKPTHDYSLAALEPVSGRSLGQLAAASRSFHRSQDMGREQVAGPARGGLVWLAGGAKLDGEGPFAGVDTRLAAIVEEMPAGEARRRAAALLGRVEAAARSARGQLSPLAPGTAAPALAEILAQLRQAEDLLAAAGPGAAAARALVAEKAEIAAWGLAAAAGVVIEALADREAAAPGTSFEVEATVWSAGGQPVEVLSVGALSAPGWLPERLADGGPDEDGVWRRRLRVGVPAYAAATVPYYLRRPREGDLYAWEAAPPVVRGEALGPPPLQLVFQLEIAGQTVSLAREVVHRFADQAFGERRRPLRAVPPVEVTLEPSLLLLADGAGERSLAVTVRSNLAGPVGGSLRLSVGGAPVGGEGAAVEGAFRIEGVGRSLTHHAVFEPPAAAGRYTVEAAAELEDGRRVGRGLRMVSYPHIRPLALPTPAASELVRFALALPRLGRVGYVRGASDRVPEVLAAVGLPIELLDAEALERGDLSGLDAIVVGSRAYETDEALRRANPRLLEYARAGGLLVVQYQQYQFVGGGYAPLPLEILRPHGRVTDEMAEVRVLAPGHPVFNRPNRIAAADWDGWVQERGLYFAGRWDEAYEPLLALADPGREAERGALLVAPLGDGTYVYTGLSFFRQLPAGVAGAVRLFVNLLALGER